MILRLTMTLLIASGCSPSSSHPAALGGCTDVHDASASCGYGGAGGGGGGTSSSSSGGNAIDAAGVDAPAVNCGASTTTGSLATSNLQCAPCIVASCCQAGTACADSTACAALLSCNASNINACEAQYPSGVSAYNDFASCLQASCSPQCPTLPLATSGDF